LQFFKIYFRKLIILLNLPNKQVRFFNIISVVLRQEFKAAAGCDIWYQRADFYRLARDAHRDLLREKEMEAARRTFGTTRNQNYSY
jgi:hypothetical protein